MSKTVIYTDGGCTGNPGPGGWGTVILTETKKYRLSGGDPSTTNNKMEMTAVIRAMEFLCSEEIDTSEVEIYADSQYVLKGITEWMTGWIKKGWVTAAKKPVKNKELWLQIKALDDEISPKWFWVKGHSGNQYNEECDQLVEAERLKFS